jgi:flagellar basal-body rod modification protein FlgD
MSDFSFDLNGVLGTQSTVKAAENTTNKKAGSDMVMDDFLKLMVAQFQNQSIDSTADTTEMMNQMVQMSVIQAITNLSTLVSDSTNLSYAASLVGKEVTIGQRSGSEIEELLGTVTGTGTLDGKQVIFLDNQETPYNLTDIMAVGRLPELKRAGETSADTNGDTSNNGARDPHVPDENGALG